MMKTYEVIDVCNGLELIRIIDLRTGSILDHAISVPLASRGSFRLVKLLDCSFGKVLEYLIFTANGTPVDTFGPTEFDAAHSVFVGLRHLSVGLRKILGHSGLPPHTRHAAG